MKKVMVFINTLLICLLANSVLFFRVAGNPLLLIVGIMLLVGVNVMPLTLADKLATTRIRICYHGSVCLQCFWYSVIISVIYHIVIAFKFFPDLILVWLLSALMCTFVEAVVFWNGMISVYTTSVQLGVTNRLYGIICGCIPIANLYFLRKIIKTTSEEVEFETEKIKLDYSRSEDAICATRYPIVMVHGVFFRDFRGFNYWGRIPEALKNNGAKVYYGNQQSAASVIDCGRELTERIKEIVRTTGCEKVNIIAHSKGGLDSRYAISCLGASEYVASVTTVNTPHRGCEFADYLLDKIPHGAQKKVESTYNMAMRRIGDPSPDFMAAVTDLTANSCKLFNEAVHNVDGVYYQSVGSKLNHASSGKFPLNYSYHLVKYFDGPNDGLVSESSFPWGENYTFLTNDGRRGISHGDMIDLNRENIKGFDVREFYVGLVADLKKKGF